MTGGAKRQPRQSAVMLAAALLAVTLFGFEVQAAPLSTPRNDSSAVQRDGGITRQLNLGIGKSVIVDLPREAAEVVVAKPGIADAVVRSSRRLYVIAMAGGQTTIFAMDAQGRQIARIDVTVGRDIAELDRILKTAMPRSNIVLRTVNDTIILTGEVDSAEEAQKAADIANGFVSQANANSGGVATNGNSTSPGSASATPSGQTNSSITSNFSFGPNTNTDGKVINSLVIRGKDQVMLKVTIAEVQRQVLKQLGVTAASANGSWGTFQQDNGLPLNLQKLTTGETIFGASSPAAALTAPLSATLTAFERNGVARVLAEPTVTAVSGESAKFTAGGEIPVPQNETCPPQGTPGYCTVGVQFKNYGVTLNFTPVVLSAGRILLRVATEVTEVDPQQSFQFVNINVPGFRTRKNETSVELPSGGSIVSAGLLQVTSTQVVNGLPGLMNLPVLGQLFRSRDYQRKETELMIIVTPYIAKPVAPNEIARPTDGFADASDPQAALLGRVNRIYSTTSNPILIQNFKGRVGFIND